MKKPPCAKNCMDRVPGCHSRCPAYLDWKAELEKDRASAQKKKDTDFSIIEVKKNGMRKSKKK